MLETHYYFQHSIFYQVFYFSQYFIKVLSSICCIFFRLVFLELLTSPDFFWNAFNPFYCPGLFEAFLSSTAQGAHHTSGKVPPPVRPCCLSQNWLWNWAVYTVICEVCPCFLHLRVHLWTWTKVGLTQSYYFKPQEEYDLTWTIS